MKYKLLVLDIDGTLIDSEKKITSRTRHALLKVQQAGVRIVLASGRPTHGIMPLARELELDRNGGYIIPYNGSQIIDMQTGNVCFERHIDRTMLPYLQRKAAKNGFALLTYQADRLLTDSPDHPHVQQEAQLNGLAIEPITDVTETIDFDPYKCIVAADDEEALDDLETHWKRRLAGSLDVYRSESYFLEVVPMQVDKAYTLSVLLEELQIDPADVVAIGDGVRDVAMLQLAGMGIAMANAKDSVKACADDVTATNDDEGVTAAVEKYILPAIRPDSIPLEQLNANSRHGLVGHLGIQFTYTSADRIEATMPVDLRTRQPFGILHGGATLALAETVAGLGSMLICKPDEMMVGMQVSGNHVSSAHEGDTVRAVGTLLHRGQSSHVWNVDVYTSTDKLVSSIRVLNSVMRKK